MLRYSSNDRCGSAPHPRPRPRPPHPRPNPHPPQPRPRARSTRAALRHGRAAGDVGPYHCPTCTHSAPTIVPPAPTRPLPFSHPHPLGPDVGSTTARRAKYPRRPRRVASTLSHPMRAPPAAKLSHKKSEIFVIEGCRRHTFLCRTSRGYVPRPIKQGESGVSGGVCAACIFGDLSE